MGSSSDYTMQVVKELQGGELLYPKNIPGDRGNTALVLQIVIIIGLLAACVYLAFRDQDLTNSLKYSYYCTICNISVLMAASFIWKFCNLCEELNHVHSRYNDRISTVFKSALHFNTLSIIVIVLCACSIIIMIADVNTPQRYLLRFGLQSYMFSLSSSVLIVRLIKPDEGSLETSLKLSEFRGMDYGSGMAYSYFYGYLNIVLPFVGDETKGLPSGLKENIEQYEAMQNVTIPVKKLFILIPTSLRTPPDLKEASYDWLESVTPLASVTKSRAGTLKRTFHNTVYKIHPGGITQQNGPSVYVITEGATPLLTFYEVLQHSGKDSTAYEEFRTEIVGSFYRTLLAIIKSKPECRDLCELVFYEDIDPDGKRVNVAKILLDKIKDQVDAAL